MKWKNINAWGLTEKLQAFDSASFSKPAIIGMLMPYTIL